MWNIPELRRLLSEVIPKATAVLGYEVNGKFPNLGLRTMLVSARRLIHPDDNSTSVLVVFEDVTDRQRAAADKDILLAETHHRMKNLLAIVRAVATQTAVEGRTAKDYRDTFLGRFEAIVQAEDLSTSERDLGALVAKALVSVGADRFRVVGPTVRLEKSQIMPFILILHELVTNAWKYGAFSKADGVAHIEWKVVSDGAGNALHFAWREENGPPVVKPDHHGFGSELIKYSAEHALQGTAELSYEPSGFKLHMVTPLEMAQ